MKFKRGLGFYDFATDGGSPSPALLPRIVIIAFLILAATQTLTLQLKKPVWTKNISVSIPNNMPKFLSGQREPTNYQGTHVDWYFTSLSFSILLHEIKCGFILTGDDAECVPPTLDEAGLKEYGCEIVTTACFDQVRCSSLEREVAAIANHFEVHIHNVLITKNHQILRCSFLYSQQ